jgi:primosomal protein N' (replication factor Y) (superfamily II helicase)
MSLDKIDSPSPLLEIIPLDTKKNAGILSQRLIDIIWTALQEKKKLLLFYNRRWSARAWICQDCGYFEKCPHCDISFAHHAFPDPHLVCHQCWAVAPFPIVCWSCWWTHTVPIGIWIQKIETEIATCFWNALYAPILRIDSDVWQKVWILYEKIECSSLILATNMASTLKHSSIHAVVFLHFEVNLGIPEYDLEEQIFQEITYYKRQKLPIYIQTYIPEHPLLQQVVYGNTKDMLFHLVDERKTFQYPPFFSFAIIRVHHEQKKRVVSMMLHLIQKLECFSSGDIFIAFDKEIWEKRWWEWTQKITLKWKDILPVIRSCEVEILKNRFVTLEWY